MVRKIIITLIIFGTFGSISCAQSKMLTGQKHVIFVNIPKNWVQAQNDQLPFFIKPDEQNVNAKTYQYVYGLDYQSAPDLNLWIKGDNDDMVNRHPGLKIDSLNINLDNIKKTDYETGRFKIITYTYPDHHKEVMLVIECKNTIVTAVLSVSDESEFDRYLPSFKELAQSLRVLGATVKIEK
jgi:hypothetical protein